MKTLDRYIGRTVIGATLTVLIVLMAIFTFFAFVDELEDVGRGTYTLGKASLVVVLSLPGLAYDLFPMAALIGCLLGLGALSERSEIAVVRCAGVSKLRVIWSVMKAGLLFVFVAVMLGEVLFPPAEQNARSIRAAAIESRSSSHSEHGFWARDGRSFVNIGEILPGEEFRHIQIFEFDDQLRLRIATRADSARYVDGNWELEGLGQSRFSEDGEAVSVDTRSLDAARWDSVLDPDIIEMVAIKPHTLSLAALARYVSFARENGQNAQRWEHALWRKIGYPLATAVMVFLAVPLVLTGSRAVSSGRRVMVGALIGLGFHILNQTSGHLGVVFGVPAAASALGPTLILLAVGTLLNHRAN